MVRIILFCLLFVSLQVAQISKPDSTLKTHTLNNFHVANILEERLAGIELFITSEYGTHKFISDENGNFQNVTLPANKEVTITFNDPNIKDSSYYMDKIKIQTVGENGIVKTLAKSNWIQYGKKVKNRVKIFILPTYHSKLKIRNAGEELREITLDSDSLLKYNNQNGLRLLLIPTKYHLKKGKTFEDGIFNLNEQKCKFYFQNDYVKKFDEDSTLNIILNEENISEISYKNKYLKEYSNMIKLLIKELETTSFNFGKYFNTKIIWRRNESAKDIYESTYQSFWFSYGDRNLYSYLKRKANYRDPLLKESVEKLAATYSYNADVKVIQSELLSSFTDTRNRTGQQEMSDFWQYDKNGDMWLNEAGRFLIKYLANCEYGENRIPK